MLAFNGGMQLGGKAFAASKTITSLRRATDSTIFNKTDTQSKVLVMTKQENLLGEIA